jgi:hypothetical protein
MSEEENPYGARIDFTTAEDGTFTCPSVPIGVYSLDCADGKIEVDAQDVKVRPGVQAGPVKLTGRAMVRVKGRVDLTDLEVEGSIGILLLTPKQAFEKQDSGRFQYKGVPFSTSTGEFTTELAPGEYHVSLLSGAFTGENMVRLTDLVVPGEGLSQVVLRKK